MDLMVKERAFSLRPTYDIYGQDGQKRYYVERETRDHRNRVYVLDHNGTEVGYMEKRSGFRSCFDIYVQGIYYGKIERQFAIFHGEFIIDYKGWYAEGDLLSREYSVYEADRCAVQISRDHRKLSDVYYVSITEDADELPALLLVLAIDIIKQ